MKKPWGKNNLSVLFGLIILLLSLSASAGAVKEVSYLYKLSTFTGTAPVGLWPKLRLDSTNHEIYAVSGDEIKVFDKNGMEIYQISLGLNDDETAKEQLFVTDAVVKKNGDIIYLTQAYDKGKTLSSLLVADFRGDPISRLKLRNFPSDLADFQADRLFDLDGLIYLADVSEMRIAVIDEEGSFQRAYEIKALLRKHRSEESSRSRKNATMSEEDLEMGDFAVDKGGNIVFTIPSAGSAYRLTPDLQLQLISKRGSGAGKFGIPAAIAADARGNYLVSDVLRSVVMVFDKDLKYIDAFGGRFNGEASIVAPRGLVIDWNDRVYVSQVESMGVSVFQLGY